MKKKEIKNLARKIAKAELIIETSDDKEKIKLAKKEIMSLSGSVNSLEDILLLDEEVQNILSMIKLK